MLQNECVLSMVLSESRKLIGAIKQNIEWNESIGSILKLLGSKNDGKWGPLE